MTVDHLDLIVSSLERSLEFYRGPRVRLHDGY
jgi:catechol 2,3-dioxygenase-like lactoylglutathione lyase family enzyme